MEPGLLRSRTSARVDEVPLAQLDTVEGRARRLSLHAGGDDRPHRAVLNDQLNDDADVTDQFGGQDLHARLHQLLAQLEGVGASAQG